MTRHNKQCSGRPRGADTPVRFLDRKPFAILLFCLALPLFLLGNSADDQPRVPSDVAWTHDTIELASSGDAFRGSLIAKSCAHCHGSEGFSSEPGIPNLAGIDRLSIWKQLQDFRSGKRYSPVMQPIAVELSSRNDADVSAYFSMLPTFSDPQDNRVFPQAIPDPKTSRLAENLIVFGDAHRGIPPCESCHGPVGFIRGAPSLATQNAGYLLEQLQHFAQGLRTNDIDEVMRIVSSQLTDEEKSAVSAYYGAGRGPSAPRPPIP
ncbi:MAG TPA: hypothetical protein VMX38_21460 [Verrucomicrobiae bacterium]|nr:hypothetical protein [Verrucomicrobiae bacterium]